MSHSPIFELQTYLRNISRLDKDISPVVPDGIFGKETALAVESFQKKYGLEVTGEVDFKTWEKLKSESAKAEFYFSQPIQIVKIKNEDLPLSLGESNNIIYTLHLMLNKLADTFDNFTHLDLDSTFNEGTLKNVLLWQKVISHKQTGEVDKVTWNTLAMAYLL